MKLECRNSNIIIVAEFLDQGEPEMTPDVVHGDQSCQTSVTNALRSMSHEVIYKVYRA